MTESISQPLPASALPSKPLVVSTQAGTVTLAELATLKATLADTDREASSKLDQATSLEALRDDRLVQIGNLLLDHSSGFAPDEQLKMLLDRAASLGSALVNDDSKLESIRTAERHGLSGLVGRVGGWNESRKVTADKAAVDIELRTALLELGRRAPQIDIQDLGTLEAEAKAADGQATELRSAASALTTSATLFRDEIQRREAAQSQMGFDSLYLAAYLQTYGGQGVVDSPLNLKRGERALAAVPAKLARNQTRTRWVGGSQGFSFPIGHTGIRYRVGSYHGHPVQQQVLTTLDSGTFVITNQRIAFIGPSKSTSVALSKLVHVECYSDALAVFQEGRENADYYLMQQPKYSLFMINWAAAQTPA